MAKNKSKMKAKPEVKKRARADGRESGDDEGVNKLSSDYYQDEVAQFHDERDKIPLDTKFAGQKDDSDSEEEVLAVYSDDEDDSDLDQEMADNLSRLQRNLTNEEMASDIEDQPEDDGLPDSQAWGKVKHKYYGADVHDDDDIESDESELGTAVLEEQEALAIQKRLAQQLDDQDFGLDTFKPTTKVVSDKDEIVVTKDLSKLTRREKLELLKKESPEFLDLIEDYKVKMQEAQEVLHPVLLKIKSGEIPEGAAATYVDVKFRLILSYCVNVSFYLMLKAKHQPVHDHPVINRIVQYRGLLQQLEDADDEIKLSLEAVLEKIQNREPLNLLDEKSGTSKTERLKTKLKPKTEKKLKLKAKVYEKKRKKVSELLEDSDDEAVEKESLPKKKLKKSLPDQKSETDHSSALRVGRVSSNQYETRDERAALEYYEMMKAGKRSRDASCDQDGGQSSEDDDRLLLPNSPSAAPGGEDSSDGADDLAGPGDDVDELEGDAKRGITKQIEKNRGLTPHRNKDNKNPRVKHRKKFRKAKIRRKGAVREFRPETKRYGGELSGIRAGVKKSIKLK